MPGSDVDRYRQSVYRAEDQWSALIDRGGAVDFFGSQLTAPVQMRFGSLADVTKYVEHLCRLNDVPQPRVRDRKGGARAHYEVVAGESIIAIPANAPWAMRESVVLHEISHHVCVSRFDSALHDQHFTSTMLALVHERLGDEAHLLLRTGYQAAGAPV